MSYSSGSTARTSHCGHCIRLEPSFTGSQQSVHFLDVTTGISNLKGRRWQQSGCQCSLDTSRCQCLRLYRDEKATNRFTYRY